MAPIRQKRWNVLATLALVVAALISLNGISRLDVGRDSTADRLQLSSAPRYSSLEGLANRLDQRHSFRSEAITERERQQDANNAERAPFRVKVGVYATNTYDLDLTVPSFTSNGYLWMKWGEPLQRYLEQQQVGLEDKVVLLNALLANGEPKLRPVDQPERLADGSYYQLFYYRARLYIDHASFQQFPFSTISLPLMLEADDLDGELNYQNLRFEPDQVNSGMGLFSGVIGWIQRGWAIAEYHHSYATNFGLPGTQTSYSTLVFDVILATSAWAGFWRLILPLLVLLTMVLLVSKVRSDAQDSRASIPVTVLLTLVFLQQDYRSELPKLPFLTFLDQVYVVAYVITLVAFVLVIWIGRRYQDLEGLPSDEQRERQRSRLQKLDEIWPLAMVAFTTLSILLCWVNLPTTT